MNQLHPVLYILKLDNEGFKQLFECLLQNVLEVELRGALNQILENSQTNSSSLIEKSMSVKVPSCQIFLLQIQRILLQL